MRNNVFRNVRRGVLCVAAIIGLSGGVIMLEQATPAEAQTSCFTQVGPRSHATHCFAYPTSDPDFDMSTRYAAEYCDRWMATGTILPCPYARTAAEASGGALPAAEDGEDRGNRWRSIRN